MRTSDRLRTVGPIGRTDDVDRSFGMWDVVLLRPDRAVIVFGGPGTYPFQGDLHLVVVNPVTATTIDTLTITLPNPPVLNSGGFFRYSDQSIGFVTFDWDYHQEGGPGSFQFGTIGLDGIVRVGVHVREHGTEHQKDTAQQFYYDLRNSTVTAMYWSTYHFERVNGVYQFNTVAWAVNLNLQTLESSEFQVFVNMGTPSDSSAYPQYYGTLPLPGNRAIGATWLEEDGDWNGYRLHDNNGTVLDEVRVPLPNGFNGVFLYQAGTSPVVCVAYSQYEKNNTVEYGMVQRYRITPTAVTKLGTPVKLGRITYPSYNLPLPERLAAQWFDDVNPYAAKYRFAPVIYANNHSMDIWNGSGYSPPDNSGLPMVAINHSTGGFTQLVVLRHADMDIPTNGVQVNLNWLPASAVSDYAICAFIDKVSCWYQLIQASPGELAVRGSDRPPIIFRGV